MTFKNRLSNARFGLLTALLLAAASSFAPGASRSAVASAGRFATVADAVQAGVVTQGLASQLATGRPLVVLGRTRNDTLTAVGATGHAAEGQSSAAQRRALVAEGKDDVRDVVQLSAEQFRDYPNLPAFSTNIRTEEELLALANSESVARLTQDRLYHQSLTDNLAWIGQPAAVNAGATGAGTFVALIDSGVDMSRPAFGSCTAVNTPATCRVARLPPDFTTRNGVPYSDGQNDDGCASLHGTHVAGIIAGTAPATKLVVADVFQPVGSDCRVQAAWGSDILAAVDYLIGLKVSGLNIVTANMSFGDDTRSLVDTCIDDAGIGYLRSVGIQPVAAAGNFALSNGIYQGDGVSSPACVAGTIPVGAVALSGQQAPFSQSAPLPSMIFAPGANISSAGLVKSGTSMATPFIAAALAMVNEARPDWTMQQRAQFLRDSSLPVANLYQDRLERRLDLSQWPAMLRAPTNDDRSSADPTTTQARLVNAYAATSEPGEAAHGGVPAQRTIWYRHVMTRSGRLNVESQNAIGVYSTRADSTSLSCVGNAFANCVRVAGEVGDVIDIAISGTSANDWYLTSKFAESGEMYLRQFLSAPTPTVLTIQTSGASVPRVTVVDLLGAASANPYAARVVARNAPGSKTVGPFMGSTLAVLIGDVTGPVLLMSTKGVSSANDSPSMAVDLHTNSGERDDTTVSATPTTGDAFDRDLWYRWTAAGSGRLIVRTAGSNIDAQLCLSSPTAQDCATGTPDSGGASAVITVEPGDVVQVRAGIMANGVGQGTLRLRWEFVDDTRHVVSPGSDGSPPQRRTGTPPVGAPGPTGSRTPAPRALGSP